MIESISYMEHIVGMLFLLSAFLVIVIIASIEQTRRRTYEKFLRQKDLTKHFNYWKYEEENHKDEGKKKFDINYE